MIVTAGGTIDLALPVFQSGEVAVLVVTTQAGAQRIHTHALPQTVQVVALKPAGRLSAWAILLASVLASVIGRMLLSITSPDLRETTPTGGSAGPDRKG